MKSAGHGCLAMADAIGAQATERFGKKSAVRLAFLGVTWTATWDAQSYKRKKTRSKVCEYFFPSFDISSHRLQFTRHTFPVTDVTWASLLSFWLAVCYQASSSNKQTLNKLNTAMQG